MSYLNDLSGLFASDKAVGTRKGTTENKVGIDGGQSNTQSYKTAVSDKQVGPSGTNNGLTNDVDTSSGGMGGNGEGEGKGPSSAQMNAAAGAVGSAIQPLNDNAQVKDQRESGVNAENVQNFRSDVGSISYNNTDDYREFDFNVSHSAELGKQEAEAKQSEEAVKGTMESLPVIGGWSTLGRETHGAVLNVIPEDQKEEDWAKAVDWNLDPIGTSMEMLTVDKETETTKKRRLDQEYTTLEMKSVSADRAKKIKDSFAYGGDSDTSSAHYKEIEIGGTHEQNEAGGVTFGKDSKGVDNTAEEGEVIVNLPGRKNYVFSNRF